MINSTIYYGLVAQYGSTEVLTQKVTEACPAVRRLYLLGLTLASRRTESLFTQGAPRAQSVAHYYLLAIIDRSPGAGCDAVQDKIENNLLHWVPVTAIVVEEIQFATWIEKGHPFAHAVVQKGLLLHGAPEACFPSEKSSGELYGHDGRHAAKLALERGKGLLAGAALYALRTEYPLALFLLHQVTEQCLRALILLHTGLRVNTHNLDKLLRYGSLFSHSLPQLFRRESQQEKERFALLQAAYVGSRYRDDFKVASKDVAPLQGSVESLMKLLEESNLKQTI